MLVPLDAAAEQIGLPVSDLFELARRGEVEILTVLGKKLVVLSSLERFARRVRDRERRAEAHS